jgi:hypothetical protein
MIEEWKNGKGGMMKNTDSSRSQQIDGILFKTEACYPGDLDSMSLDIWHEALAEFDIEEISKAFTIHVKQSKFLPVISEIIQIIEHNKGPQVSIEARAQQQWRVVMTAVRQRGLNQGAPIFADPITANFVKTQFRWTYLCEIKEQDEKWEQKRWCEAFELAIECHPDLKQIDALANVKELAANVTKPLTEPESAGPNSVPIETMRELRKKLSGQVQSQEVRESQIALLKEQARQIQREEDRKK